MNVDLLVPVPFAGRDALRNVLDSLPAASVARALARIVADEMAPNDGAFVRVGPIVATNLPVLQREMLKRWQAGGWQAADPTAVEDQEVKKRLVHAARQLTALRSEHPSLDRDLLELPGWHRIIRALWFGALEQEFLNRSPRTEVARAMLLYRTIWPELAELNDRRVTRPKAFDTAFRALHYLVVASLVLLRRRGFVDDIVADLSATNLADGLAPFLEFFTFSGDEFCQRDAATASYPTSFSNPFVRTPILRLGDYTLFAPDPSALFSGIEYRVLQQALADGMQEGTTPEDGFKAISGSFGHVFEEYGRRLIDCCCPAAGQFVPEFPYDTTKGQVMSPDAFLLGEQSVMFEFKALRFPHDREDRTRVTDFVDWIGKLAGANDDRGPLEQGAAFLTAMRAAAAPQLGGTDVQNALYVVVSYQDVPPVANWARMRRHFWENLSAPALQLLPRAAFISIRDLEIAVTVAEFETTAGRLFSLAAAIRHWWEHPMCG
jgi:hypothetical protein